MKRKLLIVVLMSALCVGFVACNDTFETQGKDVSFTTYPLGGGVPGEDIYDFHLNPDYFDVPWGEGNLFIINGEEELKKYVERDYPAFDFSKNTLLLIGGYSPTVSVHKTIKSFRHFSTGKYKLELELSRDLYAMMEIWSVAILTDKMSSDSKIELSITTKY